MSSHTLASEWLKCWLSGSIVAYFSWKWGSDVIDFIVVNGGKQPMWQLLPWSMVKWTPQQHVWECCLASLYIAGIVRPWTLLYVGRSHVLRGGRQTAMNRTLFLVQDLRSAWPQGWAGYILLVCLSCLWWFIFLMVFLIMTVIAGSTTLLVSWETITATSGAMMHSAEWKFCVDEVEGLQRPRPPSWTGRLSRSLSTDKHSSCPVMAWIRCWCIASSSGSSR